MLWFLFACVFSLFSLCTKAASLENRPVASCSPGWRTAGAGELGLCLKTQRNNNNNNNKNDLLTKTRLLLGAEGDTSKPARCWCLLGPWNRNIRWRLLARAHKRRSTSCSACGTPCPACLLPDPCAWGLHWTQLQFLSPAKLNSPFGFLAPRSPCACNSWYI